MDHEDTDTESSRNRSRHQAKSFQQQSDQRLKWTICYNETVSMVYLWRT